MLHPQEHCNIRMDRVRILAETLALLVDDLAKDDPLTICETLEATALFTAHMMVSGAHQKMSHGDQVTNTQALVQNELPTRVAFYARQIVRGRAEQAAQN